MSNQQHRESERTATDLAWEGTRLLSTGDYRGAINACNQAIELDPTSLGAQRTREEAYRRMGKVAPTDASLIKTTTQGRVQSALAPFIEFLAGQGYRPKWRWESTGDRYDRYPDREESITVGRIELASGPISSVELSSTTEATGEETPHEQPSYAVEWNTTNQVSYYLEPSWAQSGVPGLQLLTIYKSGNTWTGNDMGLGIIDRINSDESLRTLPTSVAIAAVEPETPPRPRCRRRRRDRRRSTRGTRPGPRGVLVELDRNLQAARPCANIDMARTTGEIVESADHYVGSTSCRFRVPAQTLTTNGAPASAGSPD